MKKVLFTFMVAFFATFALQAQNVVENVDGLPAGVITTWMGLAHPADATLTVAPDPFGGAGQALRFEPRNFNAVPFVALTIPAGKTLGDFTHFNFRGHFVQGDVGLKTIFVAAFSAPPTGGLQSTNPNIIGSQARNSGGSTAWENLSIPLTVPAAISGLTGTVYIAYGISTAATGNIGGTGLATRWYSDDLTLVPRPPLVTSLEVTSPAAEITVNAGTLQMAVTNVLPAGASTAVTWSVAPAGLATINAAGLLTAISNGAVTVTATATDGSGISATRAITITGQPIPVTGITVTGAGDATTIATAGGTLQMSAAITPAEATNQAVTWSVTPAGLATIDAAGLLTAVANGTVTVTATAADGSNVSGTLAVTITGQPIRVSSIGVTSAGGVTIIAPARTLQMSAAVLPTDATNRTVTWSVSDVGVATISATGLLTAVANGAVTVTATANDLSGVVGTLAVTVSDVPVPVASISVAGTGGATSITAQNGLLVMVATVETVNATNRTVRWSVDNIGVATINAATGRLTAMSNGEVTVTATALDGSGVTGSALVTVSGQLPFGRNVIENLEGLALDSILPEIRWNAPDIVASIVADPFLPATGNKVMSSVLTNWNAAPVLAITLPAGRSLADYMALNFMGHFTGADAGWKDVHLLAFQTLPTGAMQSGSPNRLSTINRNRAASTAWEDFTLPFNNAAGVTNTAALTGTIYIAFGMHANNARWYADEITLVARPLVTSLEVTSPVAEITVNAGTLQMTVTNVLPENSRRDVTWSVSDANLATISAAGLLTAASNGTIVVTATANDGSGVTATREITITGQWPTGIEGNAVQAPVIFPNPVGDQLNISGSEPISRVVVSNLSGQAVLMVEANDSSLNINVSDLAKGVYVVTV